VRSNSEAGWSACHLAGHLLHLVVFDRSATLTPAQLVSSSGATGWVMERVSFLMDARCRIRSLGEGLKIDARLRRTWRRSLSGIRQRTLSQDLKRTCFLRGFSASLSWADGKLRLYFPLSP